MYYLTSHSYHVRHTLRLRPLCRNDLLSTLDHFSDAHACSALDVLFTVTCLALYEFKPSIMT
jgi:hypothetical protein